MNFDYKSRRRLFVWHASVSASVRHAVHAGMGRIGALWGPNPVQPGLTKTGGWSWLRETVCLRHDGMLSFKSLTFVIFWPLICLFCMNMDKKLSASLTHIRGSSHTLVRGWHSAHSLWSLPTLGKSWIRRASETKIFDSS